MREVCGRPVTLLIVATCSVRLMQKSIPLRSAYRKSNKRNRSTHSVQERMLLSSADHMHVNLPWPYIIFTLSKPACPKPRLWGRLPSPQKYLKPLQASHPLPHPKTPIHSAHPADPRPAAVRHPTPNPRQCSGTPADAGTRGPAGFEQVRPGPWHHGDRLTGRWIPVPRTDC